jgi:hypothetical protein
MSQELTDIHMAIARNFVCEATGDLCKGINCRNGTTARPRFCEIDAAPSPLAPVRAIGSVTRRTPTMPTRNRLREREKIALKIVRLEEKERGRRFQPHIRGSRIANLIFSPKVDAVLKSGKAPEPFKK